MTEIDIQKAIISHYEQCFLEHGDTHLGVDWPNRDDALRRYDVMLAPALLNANSSLHDYGCGLAHLYQHIVNRQLEDRVEYSGSDASQIFTRACQKKFPNVPFTGLNFRDEIFMFPDSQVASQYIVANGVFTEKRELPFELMWHHTKETLSYLFQFTEVCLSVNFMSSYVDWQRDDLFHLPVDTLLEFCSNRLSRHVNIVSNYGLYEYTAHIFKAPMP